MDSSLVSATAASGQKQTVSSRQRRSGERVGRARRTGAGPRRVAAKAAIYGYERTIIQTTAAAERGAACDGPIKEAEMVVDRRAGGRTSSEPCPDGEGGGRG